MMDKTQLVWLDMALWHATGSQLPFGGLHVVLAGDFFQMPPVWEVLSTSGQPFWQSHVPTGQ